MEAVSRDQLVKVFGSEDLVKLFQELDLSNQNKILNTSFKAASKLIIGQAQSNLKGQYTRVSKSLTTSFKRDIQTLNVGASKKLGGHLAHIAEAGTKERSYTNKNGILHKTGKITANFFFSNAIQQTEKSVEEVIFKEIRNRFNKIIQKNNKTK